MTKKIIIINGTGASGKDTFIEYTSKYEKIFNFSSIDIIKKIAKNAGWNGTKTEKDRKFLSDLKKLTTEYNDLAFTSIKEAVKYFNSNKCVANIMFIHIREPEEIERAVKAFNAKTLLVKRLGHANIITNYSDANVDNYSYDYIITNTTLKELDHIAKNFVIEINDNNNTILEVNQ